jgi:GxxExxY protein
MLGSTDPGVERLAQLAVDAAFHLYRDLGPGLIESVYERLLAMRLEKLGLKVDRQMPIDILYDGVRFRGAFTADILVEDRLLIEPKSTERTAPVHVQQLLTYLRLMELPLGLLMNFGAATFREGIRRVANGHKPLAS